MNTEELRSTFKDILNRTDCTEAQVNTLMTLGLGRIERTLRLDLQKTSTTVTGSNAIALPQDFLSLVLVKLDGVTCQRVPETYDPVRGSKDPVYWIKNGILEFPNNPVGTSGSVRIEYFRKSPSIASFGRYADLIIYAALCFAADLFVDDRKPTFEASYTQIAAEVQLANDIDQMTGLDLRVRNPYEGYV